MYKRGSVLVAVLVGLLFVAATPADAGRPIYKSAGDSSSSDNPKVVPDAQNVYSYYADLAPNGRDVYAVYATEGQDTTISVQVPRIDSLQSFNPTVTIVGRAITSTVLSNVYDSAVTKVVSGTTGTTGNEQIDRWPDKGQVVLTYAGDPKTRAVASDGLTLTSYWQGQQYKTTYPLSGPYLITVSDPAGAGGKYRLDVGSNDDAGIGDIVKSPYTWFKINSWAGNWLNIAIAALVLLGLIAALVLGLRRRERKTVVVTTTTTTGGADVDGEVGP